MRRGSRGAVVTACIAVVAVATLVGTEGNAGAASRKPGAPTGVGAQPGNGAATVSWTAPTSTGSSPITGYLVATGSKSCSTTGATTCTVTGLRNGQTYKVKVRAENSQVKGPASAVVEVEAGLPGTPSGVLTTSENGAVLVSWTPAADNGFPISNYNVVASPGPRGCNAAATTSCTVSGLTNGSPYTFTVSATNAKGTGADSTPSAPTTPATVPGAPTGVSATAGNASATVSFSAPASTGGSAITGYTVTATDTTNSGNGGQTGTGTGSPIAVSGLTNGDSYTFTVTATNGVGTGPASAASAAVTPATVPDPPTDVSAAPDGSVDLGVLVVSFTPGFDEGSAIIANGYTVTITDQTNPSDPNNGLTVGGSGSPITVSGLTSGDTYSFTVTATNGIGTGAPSSPSTGVPSP
jgi:hypothetical protein